MKKILNSVLKKHILKIILIILLIFINIYLLTTPSKILGNIIDLLYETTINFSKIWSLITSLLVVSVLMLILRICWKYLIGLVTRTFEKDMKDRLFEHFLKLKLSSIQNIKNGELMSYFVKDVGELRGLLYRSLSHGTRVLAIGIIATFTMNKVHTELTIATMCPIIITAIVVTILKQYVEKAFKKAQKYFTSLSEYVQESTDAIRTTKAYSGEKNQLKKFIKKNQLLKKSNIAVDIYSTLLSTSVILCFGFCYGITIIYGSKLVLSNQITLGEFVAFNGYIDMFWGPIMTLPGIISKFKRAQISYHRLDKVYSLEKENIMLEGISLENRIQGDIEIKDLSFNYPENIDNVLDNISIKIKQGETLGIIGTIGSGKTTLMNLICKLYPVQNGKILIGNQDINDIDTTLLRKSICYITQDNFLFSTSIKENIKLFKTDFNDSEIEESTEKAVILDDIKNMKNGIDTIIGERGIDLSGGQKQRVAISRAFLNKSNIVIFDDTFSALDNKTEEILLKNIKELTSGKTCIIISNRISDVKDTNEIIVLDAGKIIQRGTHETLLKEDNGLYNKFYKEQSSNTYELLN